ncbi:hypothetical protein [Vibrio sp. D431a]|uniref:hypothetical protein n=1 Tax=Vibrio sp. D431a TaxID=2837388 RepID=UPI0025533543|nr:hypothetical protein [Vibrio sp. D431a]
MSPQKKEDLMGDFFEKCTGKRQFDAFFFQAISRVARRSQSKQKIEFYEIGIEKSLSRNEIQVLSPRTSVSRITNSFDPAVVRDTSPEGMRILVMTPDFPIGSGHSPVYEFTKSHREQAKTNLFVLPASLIASYEKEIRHYLESTKVTKLTHQDIGAQLPRGIILMTENHFKMSSFAETDLSSCNVVYTCYPSRVYLESAFLRELVKNLREFPTSTVYIDDESSLTSSPTNRASFLKFASINTRESNSEINSPTTLPSFLTKARWLGEIFQD